MPPARYELGHEIARGGMGRVVNATDTRLGRAVAFKEALTTDEDTLRRFQREIRITARLEHPSIVPVHDTGESSSGAPFYVMRKVSGQPLERLVAGAGTLSQRLALIPHIVASAQAIAHAHERGIVHRDIKPSNILVGDLGETIVIDWGLAKVIGEPDDPVGRPLVDLSDSLKTRVGIVYGTPGFMAPEQLRGAPVTPGFDVYALGATLYHLLSRKPPHYAKTADEMMKAAVAAPPPPIRELVDGVPPDLSTIVDKALAHDPEVRYPNARALAEDLQRFLTGQLVASHHYSPREKIVRFVRKNRGLSAAVAALVLVGALAVIRIVNERDRADAAARQAMEEARQKELTAEALTLAFARSNVDVNPTKAVAMVKRLARKHWREVRAIAAAARAAGVAWSLPASKQTLSLEMSHDGRRALSAGADGMVRLYDLGKRTAGSVLDLHARAMARFADGERQIVIWRDQGTELVILDARTGKRRDVTTSRPIRDLEVVGITAYWVDDRQALWQLDLAGKVPTQVPLSEPIDALAPSPDGRWIALSNKDHLFLYDRSQPTAPLSQVAAGQTRDLRWSTDGDHLVALIDQGPSDTLALDVAMTPEPLTVQRMTVQQPPGASRQPGASSWFVASSGGRMYVIGPNGVAIAVRSDVIGRRQITGDPVGIVESRRKAIVAGASGGLMVISEDGDHLLPLHAVHAERVLASPRAPYVIAQLADRLLVWNLDDIQPRRLTDELPGGALFATSDQVITGGTGDPANIPAQAIDVATGAAQPLGDWQGLQAVTAPSGGRVAAIIDGARNVHLVGPGRAPEDLPDKIDLAGFATEDKLVLATLDGKLYVHDVERHQRSPLVPHHARLLGLAWGRGHHAWVAAAFADGTLWRKNLVTGVEATVTRTPPLDLAHPVNRDGKLIARGDGSVLFLHDSEVHAWRADGSVAQLARLPEPIDDFGEAGTDQILAIANDTTTYAIQAPAGSSRGQVTEALPSIDGTSPSMAPDAGLLVVVDQGAVDIVDPLAHQQWTLAPARSVTFSAPVISADGRRVLAQATSQALDQTRHSLVVWSLELPANAKDTEKWLDAMTNATVDDPNLPGLGWP
jgi:ribosomal protein L12E/L44/L45/RPP1/RPP2